ncbi:putative SnoaL-like aldol condensation-catalyzing enzyme [Neolewinella xylanilytica]|uniref:Putative SnoaL-like aldol condensation-catalyzing enzyme n=1 Tax=Neolewinella xylanilytica TaxID=1514080 RepID=A0A2S6I8R0_9BACT|nr:ester cyclase [Neolewinella xylanilytica]PPK87873.1 putative SnoaL-like aldol condensation-catalyzing enzyme [Neolewinella xylanilytica]
MTSRILPLLPFLTLSAVVLGADDPVDRTAINKEIARQFYEDLWFQDRTDKYHQYVADEYIVHDIGDRKGVVEPAAEQQRIADFFWKNGTMRGNIDYQVAEGDLVVTRWTADYKPETLIGRVLLGAGSIPIINVFRFEDGKIVEIWNHRHDIDTNQRLKFVLQGLLIGLLIALIPAFFAFRFKRRIRALREEGYPSR